jgi:hypothetical protein
LSALSKDSNIRSPEKIKYKKMIQAKNQHTLAQNMGTVAPKGTRARTTAKNISVGLSKWRDGWSMVLSKKRIVVPQLEVLPSGIVRFFRCRFGRSESDNDGGRPVLAARSASSINKP